MAYLIVALVPGFPVFEIHDDGNQGEMVQEPPECGISRIYCKYVGYGIVARADERLYIVWAVSRSAAGGYGSLPEKV